MPLFCQFARRLQCGKRCTPLRGVVTISASMFDPIVRQRANEGWSMSQRMKRLGLWLGLPLLLLVAVVFVVPGLRVRVLGALRGEPFFEGRPASAWATDVVDSRDGARAASSLKKGGRAALPVLMELALHGSPEAQPKARAVIVQIGDLAVPTLTKSLEASSAEERRLAASVFGELGAAAKPALP